MMLRDELGRGWPEGFAPDEGIVQTYEEVPWRWLMLAVFALLRGVTLDDASSLGAPGLWYFLGLAALAVFVRNWTLRVRRNRQSVGRKLDDPGPLIQVLRDYGVDELGGFYLYLPVPERPEDGEARAWFRVLRAKGLVISGPWRLEVSRAPPWLRETNPKLWSGRVGYYDIYRLKNDALSTLL